MTRKEEIINYSNSFKGNGMENEELKEIIRLAIIDGAMWADANPNMDAFIEKVINFLNYKLGDVVATRVPGTIIPHHIAKQELIKDFREYMEGE